MFMFPWQEEIRGRIEKFAQAFGLSLTKQIGFGYDGLVFKTDGDTAIKGFKHAELYRNELNVYLRLNELSLFEVQGCSIPRPLANDDDLWCIEMEIVSPPFVLDFAGTHLDVPPEFPADVMAAWTAEKGTLDFFGQRCSDSFAGDPKKSSVPSWGNLSRRVRSTFSAGYQ